MNDIKLPKNPRARHGVDPWRGCQRAMNELYYGDPDIEEGPGKSTLYRGAVVIGIVLVGDELTGAPVPVAGGTWVFDPNNPGYARLLAAQLRRMADVLDKEAGAESAWFPPDQEHER